MHLTPEDEDARKAFVDALSAPETPPEEPAEEEDQPRPNPMQGKSHLPKPPDARDIFVQTFKS